MSDALEAMGFSLLAQELRLIRGEQQVTNAVLERIAETLEDYYAEVQEMDPDSDDDQPDDPGDQPGGGNISFWSQWPGE